MRPVPNKQTSNAPERAADADLADAARLAYKANYHYLNDARALKAQIVRQSQDEWRAEEWKVTEFR